MKARYLGTYTHDLIEIEGDFEVALFNNADESDYYLLDNVMKLSGNDNFSGYISDTNTGSVLVKLSDCGETAKMWRVW